MLTTPPPTHTRISAPTRPAPVQRQPFPLVATLAPVLMSAVLWMVTQSVFSLVFAALGPVIAVASLADSRRGGRRRTALEAAAFTAELGSARDEVAAAHEAERAALRALAPGVLQLLADPTAVRWGSDEAVVVVLGTADRPSSVRLDGVGGDRGGDPAATALRALAATASVLTAAPLIVPAGRGIGIAGPPAQCAAFARALHIQLLAACSPTTHAASGREAWIAGLPHAVGDGPPGVDGIRLVIAGEATISGVDTVVRLDGASGVVVRGAAEGTVFCPEFVSAEQAAQWAAGAAQTAQRAGLAPRGALPAVAFDELAAATAPLASVIGVDADGPVTLDLGGGPHAVVGGTTGSGKSELLTTWLLGMAATASPKQLSMLLVDFKGGTSFGALPDLPHCVGLVTDLDAAGAERALQSLSAELRRRERAIAAAGARSIDAVPTLGRLVIAVDEFAAMAAELPALHALFADIAARGRSLGVHLVLCTQRPAGVVRDAVLANASLRVSLRVNNRADSAAVIGSDAAAIGSAPPGRAWVAHGGGEPRQVQVALASPADIVAVAERWGSSARARRPWLDPLPRDLPPESAAGAIALVDLPGEQAQRPLPWDPSSGALLVVGGGGSGKSGALAAIAAVHGGVVVGDDVERVWDALADPPPLLLLDDVDSLLLRVSPDYQQALIDRIATALRGPTTLVLTAQRLGAALQQAASLCDHRLLLRMPTRQEHVIAGGSSDSFDPDLPPGAGWWRGDRVQLVRAALPDAAAPATSVPIAGRRVGLAVSPRPTALAARLADPAVVVTDPESFLADWGRFSALARGTAVLFHECSPAEFRKLSRRRSLPPPIADPRTTGWLLAPEGEPERVRL